MIPSDQAISVVDVVRFSPEAAPSERTADRVLVETPVTIAVDQVGSFTLLCTPADLKALAVGFARSEGMIDTADDMVDLSVGSGRRPVVGMKVADPARVQAGRNLIVASACGLCGVRTLEKVLNETPPVGSLLHARKRLVFEMIQRMRGEQDWFGQTGAAHAAAVFDSAGELIASAEDLGRHNALDKAIGKCVLADRDTAGGAVGLSGRVSFELVAKAVRAGVELIAAVSAPSSMAVEAAGRWNITLCGFVRPGRANVYTCPERLTGREITGRIG